MIIYKATNTVNNKVYIGQTIHTLDHRSSQHWRDCKRNKYYNNLFHNALIKYGICKFKWEILCTCSNQKELDHMERFYIAKYDSLNREKGYNLKSGGKEGGVCCEETKLKIGSTTKEKWKDLKIAEKMLEGLRKGTETCKLRAKNNFVKIICPTCGKEFKKKPYERKLYCSLQCASKDPLNYSKGLKMANEANVKKQKDKVNNLTPKIIEWVKLNKTLLLNVKMNKLTFINDLCKFINVKDHRTVAKILGLSNKRDLVKRLIEISENIC